MPILNYTTKISAAKTVGQIQETLAKAGCRKITIDYTNGGEPAQLTFSVALGERPLWFALPCNADGVLAAMSRDRKVPRNLCNAEQARRVAWRTVQDWCEAQLAIIEAGQAQLAEVFLPYAITASGQTLFREVAGGSVKLLNP